MCGVRHGSEVVAATVQTQVDDEFVRMLLLDQVEKPIRLLAQTFIPAKAAGDGVGVRQIGIPEIVARFLAEQRALFECGNPAYL